MRFAVDRVRARPKAALRSKSQDLGSQVWQAQDNLRMNSPISGRCTCGLIRYRCANAPLAMLNCHCRDCQASSGAPFASGVVVSSSDLEVSGTPKMYSVQASSGKLATRSFCAECGTPLFTQSEASPQFTSIRFPTIEGSSAFAPMLDIWASSAQPWVCLDPKLPHFAGSPQAST